MRLGGGTPRGRALHCLSPGTVLSPLAGNPSRSARPREPGTQPDCLPEEPLGVSGAAPPQSKDWAWGQLPEQPCAQRPFLVAQCPEAQCTTDFLELKENGQVPACLRVWAPRAAGTSLLAVLLSRAPGSLGLPALGLWVPRDRSSRSQKWGGGLPRHGGTFPWVLLGPRAGVTWGHHTAPTPRGGVPPPTWLSRIRRGSHVGGCTQPGPRHACVNCHASCGEADREVGTGRRWWDPHGPSRASQDR